MTGLNTITPSARSTTLEIDGGGELVAKRIVPHFFPAKKFATSFVANFISLNFEGDPSWLIGDATRIVNVTYDVRVQHGARSRGNLEGTLEGQFSETIRDS